MVEDDASLRELYRGTLATTGFRVLAVSDGLAALHLIEVERPDIVVLDLELPRVSGWDVYRELRAQPETKTLPVIIVTGNDLRDIHPSDVAAFLQKPVDPLVLADAVAKAVGRIGASVERLDEL